MNDRVNLWLQPLDGTPPRKITNFDDDYLLRFDLSPDGKYLMAVRGVLSRRGVHRELLTAFSRLPYSPRVQSRDPQFSIEFRG